MFIIKGCILDLIDDEIQVLDGRFNKLRDMIAAPTNVGRYRALKKSLDVTFKKRQAAAQLYNEVKATTDPSDEQIDGWCEKVGNLG